MTSAGARLRRRQPGPDPLTLLTPQQMQLAEQLAQRPAPPPTLEAADSSTAVGKPAVAATEAPLHGLGQLGLPLGPRDISSLLHQSLSGAVHQNVQFQPFVFSNIFQVGFPAAGGTRQVRQGEEPLFIPSLAASRWGWRGWEEAWLSKTLNKGKLVSHSKGASC